MSTSDQTIDATAEVIKRHCTGDTIARMMDELLDVRGNKLFRDTIEVLDAKLRPPIRLVRRSPPQKRVYSETEQVEAHRRYSEAIRGHQDTLK